MKKISVEFMLNDEQEKRLQNIAENYFKKGYKIDSESLFKGIMIPGINNYIDDKLSFYEINSQNVENRYDKEISEIQKEDKEYVKRLHDIMESKSNPQGGILIGKIPNVLIIAGAKADSDLLITKSTVNKCISSSESVYHGHELDMGIIEELPRILRNPVMIMNGSRKESFVAVTDIKDKTGDRIIVAVQMNAKQDKNIISKITSVYGKQNFQNYIRNNIEKKNVVAYNIEKADEMLQTYELQLPARETFISYDNSIAYTLENVKYLEENKTIENSVYGDLEHFCKELKANKFKITEKLCDNYARLVTQKGTNLTLQEIAASYNSGNEVSEYINAIGDELKEQELELQRQAQDAVPEGGET